MKMHLIIFFTLGLFAGSAFAAIDVDQEYCMRFMSQNVHHDKSRYSDQEPENFLKMLLDYQNHPEKIAIIAARQPWKSHLKVLQDLKWPYISEFIDLNRGNANDITFFAVYQEYMRSAWVRYRRYATTINPMFFVPRLQAADPPLSFEEFWRQSLERIDKSFPLFDSIGATLLQLDRLRPTAPADRFAALRVLDKSSAADIVFSDLILGGDSIAAQKIEMENESGNSIELRVPGADRTDLLTAYRLLPPLWKSLPIRDGDTVVDLGSGFGRAGLSLLAYGYKIHFRGYEVMSARVREGEVVAKKLALSPDQFQIVSADLGQPDTQIQSANYFYLFNPFPPKVFKSVLEKLNSKARAGEKFRVIMAAVPLFSDIPNLAYLGGMPEIRPALPDWLELENILPAKNKGIDFPFYIYKTKGL